MSAPGEEFTVDEGSPFDLALTAARAAFERRDLTVMDEQYRRAVQFARSESATLRTAVAAEHIRRLRVLNDSTRALARCEEYLAGGGEDVQLRLLRAETELSRGDHSRIDAELTAIRRLAGGRPARPADDALLNRLEGCAASRHGEWSLAEQHLLRAKDGFAALGNTAAVTVVDDDLRDLAVLRGDAASSQPPSAPERSPQVRLTRSEELRLAGCYEQALTELDPAFEGPLDRAMRFFFLEAKIRLLRLLRNDDQADKLMPALYEAARASAQPAENLVAARRLASDGAIGPSALVAPGHRLQHVRRLVQDSRLDQAERLLLAEPAPPEPDDRHAAEWHLATAELTLADADRALARQALGHLRECLRYASADTLIAIRIIAQRLLGHAHAWLDEMDEAAEAWASAHRLEERVAGLQPSHHNRVRMLRAAPDEFDERIRVAARAIERDKRWAPAVVVGMEAARGAAILPRILPGREPLVRELPSPSDIAGARRWIRRTVRGLPRSQIIWMLHATPDHVHHVFIQRTLRHVHVHHAPVPCARDTLIKSIDALTRCWQTGDTLEAALLSRDFDVQLLGVAKQLGLDHLNLPERFERIAVVAGGELSEIPFALLPCPGQELPDTQAARQAPSPPCLGRDFTLIGARYALSDLPCLSVRHPLRRRSHGQRGARGKQMLLLQPNAAGGTASVDDHRFVAAKGVPGREPLTGAQATPARLREELATGRYRQARIDSHGKFERDPSLQPIIQLDPEGAAGEMTPEDLESMRLDGTGTVVLGACETGMAKRIGRDERTGFVRAALLSGASAALAARWEALDPVAARVLDRFERNLSHHPRDVALFLAQREEDTRDRSGDPSPRQYPATKAHPARWAAWTLYGDTSYQTRRGPLLRWLLGPRNAAVPISIYEPTTGGQR